MCHFYIRGFTLGEVREGGQIAVMVQQQMQFYRTLGMAPVGPVKHGDAQLDHRAVDADQFVFEPELLLRADGLALFQQVQEKLLV